MRLTLRPPAPFAPSAPFAPLAPFVLFVLFVLFALALPTRAAESPKADSQLRDALRAATLQLRTAESDRDALQAEKTALAAENKALAAKLESLKKDFAAERVATDKAHAALKTQLAALAAELAQARESAAKWETAHRDAAALAAAKETERAAVSTDVVALRRLVEDREAKNLALYRTAREILARYEKFGLGDALAAREPFVGRTRTQLENLVQDYRDKIDGQRVQR